MSTANNESFQQNAIQERLILEAARDYAIFATDLARRVTSWNAGAEAMFGYTGADILGQSADVLYVPEDREQANGPNVPEREATKAQTEGRAENERWHLRKDGSRLYGSGVVTPLRDETGTTIGLVKVIRDLTRQKQAEEALRQSEEQFRAFVTATSDAVYRMSADWRQMHQLVGKSFLPDTSATGSSARRTSWLEQYIPPQDQALVQAAIEEAIRDRKPFELAHRVIRADGSLGWTFSRAIPILNEQDEISEWFGTAGDITAQKQAEEALARSEKKYRWLFETMDTGFAVGEAIRDERGKMVNYRLLQLNPAFEKLTGLDASEAIGKTILELLPGIDSWWLDTYQRVVDSGETIHVEEFLPPLDRWYDVTAFITGEEQFAAYYNDITQRKRQEANLIFLAQISADFAPLTSAEAIMQHVADRLAEHLQLSRCLFAVVDPEADRIEVIYDWKRDATVPPQLGVHRISDNLTELGRKHYSAGELFVMHATQENPMMNAPVDVLKAIGFGSLVDVPHRQNGRWTFLLTIGRSQAGEWRNDELDLIRELAARIYIRIERARAEEALRQSEEKFRTLFNSIDEGFCISELLYDENERVADLRYLEANPVFERHTGLKDAVGKLGSEIANVERYWLELYDNVVRTGEPHRVENYNQTTGRWYEVYASRIGDVSNRQVCTVFNDITGRKESQQHQAFLLKLSDTFRTQPNADAVANCALQGLTGQLHLDRCYIGIYRLAEDRGEFTHQVGNDRVPPVPDSVRLSDFPDALRVAFDRTLVIGDVGKTAGLTDMDRQNLGALGFSALVASTLRKGESNPLWSIVAISAQPRRWTPAEIKLIEEVTERTWTAIERARAEEALRESEKKYRTLFNAIDQGFALCELVRNPEGKGVDYRALELNPAYDKQMGMRRETLLGRTALDVFPTIDPWWIDTCSAVVNTGQPAQFEQYFEHLQRWYEIGAYRVRDEQFAVLYNDITERKRHEANLAFLAEVSRALVQLKTIDETMNALGAKIGHHFTATRCAFFEFNEAMDEAVCNHDWHQANEPSLIGSYRTSDFYTGEFLQIMRAGEAFVVTDREADSRADAKNLAALNIASCIVIPIITGQQLLFVLSINDSQPRAWRDEEIELMRELTNRIWTRLERARAEEALRMADRRKDEFLALLAHELRNPLATLSNTLLILELTGGQSEDMNVPTATSLMKREVAQLVRLVDDLLDVSRISRDKLTLTFGQLDLTALVGQTLEAVRAQFGAGTPERTNRRLTVTLPPEPLYLNGDAARLRQVVSNLLTNALKFTHEGGHVGVTLERTDGEAVLRVQDDGVGIPPHELSRIFEMFAQVDSSVARSQGGLGLGLTLVRKLMNLHGGRVDAYSAGEGQGSTFTIHLPLKTATQNDMEKTALNPAQSGQKRRILVVDDNQDAATTLAMLLKLTGNEVHTRFDGRAGVEAAESLRPRAVVLDIGMPGMDGYQACRLIREQTWGKPMMLIALSGYGQDEDKERSREAGFDAHLVKPVDMAALSGLLASLPATV